MFRSARNYRPQLDGVRALAIGVVLVAHFSPAEWLNYVDISVGYLGVVLFFVLSGFLITGILLDDRQAVGHGASSGAILTSFYVRRSLRIFPTYYFMLCYALVAGLGVMKSTFPWFATYLTNFYIVANGTPGSSTHLWSLAVEEQFYLLWPVLVIFSSRPHALILGAVVGGVVFRHLVTIPYSEYLLFACLDYLAAGAVIAVVLRDRPVMLPRVLRGCLVVAVAATIAAVAFEGEARQEWCRTAAMLTSAWLVGRAALGFSGVVGFILASRPATYVGRISYGLYLYHNFMPEGLLNASKYYGFQFSPPVRTLLAVALSFVIAAASWHFLELPVQEWRRKRFPASAAPPA